MNTQQNVVENIVKMRELSGYTQDDVAKALGLSRQSWILVEKCDRDLSTEELDRLAALFGVSITDFFENVPNLEKFKQIYYSCLKYAKNSHGSVSKTKLAKLLYLVDFATYFTTLESMSGVRYRKMQYGPLADVFLDLTDQLIEEGKITLTVLDTAQMLSLKTREAKENLLSNDELERIKQICELWKDKSTSEIVGFTHEQNPWKVCRMGEYIPYPLIIQEDPEHVYQPVA